MLTLTRKFALTTALAVVLAGCGPKEDPKVAQLQQELEAMKKELAASKDAQAGAAAGTAATAAGAADTAQAAQQAAAAAQQTATTAQQTAATAVAQAEQASRDRTATDQKLASTERALADQRAQLSDQKAAAARQAEENQRLKQDLEALKPREFTIVAGTVIAARTTGTVSTAKVKDGSQFDAILERDIVVSGTTLAKAGAAVTCIVVSSDPGGRVKGVASMAVAARSIAGVGGNTLSIKTESYEVEAGSTKKRDAVRTGIATGVGAAIGAIAGGGKGAAIGAGAGAAAGVGANMATRGEAAEIPAETLIEFRLAAPATVILRK